MPLNHTHKSYPNFVLENMIEDQFNSHLDLMPFCVVDHSLVGHPGDTKKIRVYSATDGTEKLAMGDGNSKNIEVTYNDKDYKILLAQNRFPWYDEEEMKDPLVVQTGLRHMTTDMFNTTQKDIFAEWNKAEQAVSATKLDFNAFVDAAAQLNSEHIERENIFAFLNPADVAAVRKNLKDDLKYVESFVRSGYVGTVAGINLYAKKDAIAGTVCGGVKGAVTYFVKRGVEVEQERDPNVRLNKVYSRKYYMAALTDQTKAFKITVGA